MRIVDERKPSSIKFEEVSYGQVFYMVDEEEYGDSPYMKVLEVVDNEGDTLNAVELENGALVWIEDEESVILCNALLKTY